jgi:hypothetical protein
MSRVQGSQRSKAIPILGAAGLSLTLTSGVSVAAGSTPHESARNAAVSQEMTLGEEEISDVSLATFHIFDKEGQAGKRLACGYGGGCCLFARAPSSGLGIYSPRKPPVNRRPTVRALAAPCPGRPRGVLLLHKSIWQNRIEQLPALLVFPNLIAVATRPRSPRAATW